MITGLLAFVIAAGFVTVTELAAGGSVSSNRRTSLWGGQKSIDPDPHGDADGHRDAGRGRDPDADAHGHRGAGGDGDAHPDAVGRGHAHAARGRTAGRRP